MDPIGPYGDCLMEYSIYDAIRSGFTKIILVICQDHEKIFIERIIKKWENIIDIDCVLQKIDQVPDGNRTKNGREKPWGTGHAILVAKDKVREPFTVINADDFYGWGAFETIARELTKNPATANEYSMVAYRLENTLSEYGSVSRGLCTTVGDRLHSIIELTEIDASRNQIVLFQDGQNRLLKGDSLVSMNFWGFTPRIFDLLENEFKWFLKDYAGHSSAEFFIAYPIDRGIKRNEISIKVLRTDEKWMGITYQNDRKFVKERLQWLTSKEIYPSKLNGNVAMR